MNIKDVHMSRRNELKDIFYYMRISYLKTIIKNVENIYNENGKFIKKDEVRKLIDDISNKKIFINTYLNGSKEVFEKYIKENENHVSYDVEMEQRILEIEKIIFEIDKIFIKENVKNKLNFKPITIGIVEISNESEKSYEINENYFDELKKIEAENIFLEKPYDLSKLKNKVKTYGCLYGHLSGGKIDKNTYIKGDGDLTDFYVISGSNDELTVGQGKILNLVPVAAIPLKELDKDNKEVLDYKFIMCIRHKLTEITEEKIKTNVSSIIEFLKEYNEIKKNKFSNLDKVDKEVIYDINTLYQILELEKQSYIKKLLIEENKKILNEIENIKTTNNKKERKNNVKKETRISQ